MNILLISPWDIKCGISVYAENVFREVGRMGHDVTVLAEVSDERNRRLEVPEDGVIRCWKRGDHWKSVLELVRGMRDIDVVNIQHEMSYCFEPHLWNQLIDGLHRCGLPVTVTYHTIPFAPHPITDNPEVDGVIVLNPKARDALLRRGWSEDRVWRVPHGIHAPAPLPTGPPRGRLAVHGFLAGQKGYSEAMEAVGRLVEKHPGISLTIFGALSELIKDRQEGYYYDHLRREIAHRGLQDRVAVLMGFPHQDMLHRLLADHDALVLYYQTSPGGYCDSGALHTGFAACRPVVVSEAHHFDCSPDMGGAVIRASSVDELTDHIDRLLSDPEYHRSICEQMYAFAEQRSLKASAEAYIKCLKAAIDLDRVVAPDEPEEELLGVVVLSRSRTPLLERMLNSLRETAPEAPAIVVDVVGSTEAAALVREKWPAIGYVTARRAGTAEAIRIGANALGARYAKVVTEDDILLPGWYREHRQLCGQEPGVITCTGIQLSGNQQYHLTNGEFAVDSQLCVGREALASVDAPTKPDEAADWYRLLRDAGYRASHVSTTCFLRGGAL